MLNDSYRNDMQILDDSISFRYLFDDLSVIRSANYFIYLDKDIYRHKKLEQKIFDAVWNEGVVDR